MGLLRSVASATALAERAATMPVRAAAAVPGFAVKAASIPVRTTTVTAGVVAVPQRPW
jgi:hypothetical protein